MKQRDEQHISPVHSGSGSTDSDDDTLYESCTGSDVSDEEPHEHQRLSFHPAKSVAVLGTTGLVTTGNAGRMGHSSSNAVKTLPLSPQRETTNRFVIFGGCDFPAV
jgi:hypothetical protein